MGLMSRFKTARAAGKTAKAAGTPAVQRVEDAYADVILACELMDPVEAEPFIRDADQLRAEMRRVLAEKNNEAKLLQLENELRALEGQVQRRS